LSLVPLSILRLFSSPAAVASNISSGRCRICQTWRQRSFPRPLSRPIQVQSLPRSPRQTVRRLALCGVTRATVRKNPLSAHGNKIPCAKSPYLLTGHRFEDSRCAKSRFWRTGQNFREQKAVFCARVKISVRKTATARRIGIGRVSGRKIKDWLQNQSFILVNTSLII
jgi:hypothetical protein